MIIGGGVHYISLNRTFFENFIHPTTEILMFWILFFSSKFLGQHFWTNPSILGHKVVRRVAATNVRSTTLKTESILGNHKTFFNDNQSKSSVELCYPSLRRMQKRCYLSKYSLSLVSSRQMDSFPTFLARKVKWCDVSYTHCTVGVNI